MKLHIVIDLGWAAPVLRPLAALARRSCAWLVRPLAPTGMHRFWAQALANLEARR